MEKRCSTSKGGHVGFNPTFQLTADQFSLSWISPLFFASCLVRDLLQVHSSRKSVVSMHEINGSLTFQRKVAGCWADFILKKNYNRHIMNLGWSSASIIDVVCLPKIDKTALGEEYSDAIFENFIRTPCSNNEHFARPGFQIIERNLKYVDSRQLAILCSKNPNKTIHGAE